MSCKHAAKEGTAAALRHICTDVLSHVCRLWPCQCIATCLLVHRHAHPTQLPVGPEYLAREERRCRQIRPQNEGSIEHTPAQSLKCSMAGLGANLLLLQICIDLDLPGSGAAFQEAANMPSLLSESQLGYSPPHHLTGKFGASNHPQNLQCLKQFTKSQVVVECKIPQ